MKREPAIGEEARSRFMKEVRGLWPLARGTLAEIRKPCIRAGCKACASGRKHPAVVYMFMKNGRQRCMYVPRGLAGQFRQAIANWKRLAGCANAMGCEIIRGYRLKRDSLKLRKP